MVGGGCDVIFNITGGVRNNFFVLELGNCLSPLPPDNYCTVPYVIFYFF